MVGQGTGIVTYSKDMFVHMEDVKNNRYQATRFSSLDLDSIHVYRSSDGCITELKEDLIRMIDQDKATIITGDFNICLERDPNNQITRYLTDEGFKQLVSKPTHIDGGWIDHAYFRDNKKTFKDIHFHQYSPYITDHDALCVTFNKTDQVRNPS